jgi:POT family proton-dependent oligopeptide transporter
MTGEPFGHPRGLYVLFGTEMWERMSYYGMRALLVGYLVKYLLLPGHVEHVLFYPAIRHFYEMLAGPQTVQSLSSLIYGTYTGLIYATPLLGGWLADTYLGQRATTLIGIVLMAFGHFMMASEALLFPALALLIFGGGLFKTNTSAQVGMLYKTGDARRDRAYAIFYIGINLGALLAPFICGTLGEDVGWHYGFAAAGVGMLFAALIYWLGRRQLPSDTLRARTDEGPRQKLTGQEWRSIGALLLLCIPNTLYWACNEQGGNTMSLWAMDYTDRGITLFGWHGEIPFTWFQAINPAVILFGTPLLLLLWTKLGPRAPNSAIKMVIGCVLMAAANLLMVVAVWQAAGAKSHWLWPLAYFIVMTVGEISLYPSSLSLYSKVAPARLISLIMAVNFLPNFLGGGLLQGWLGGFWSLMDKSTFFLMMAAIAGAAAVGIFLLDRPLRPYLKEAN